MVGADVEPFKVFISWAGDSNEFVDELKVGLELVGISAMPARHEIAVGEDWESLLLVQLAQADTVLFVLSPEAVKSERCSFEIQWTIRLSKRLIPLVFKPIPSSDIPADLRHLQFVRFDTAEGFARPLSLLVQTLRTDLEWIREHTRIGQLASRWEARGRPQSLLLRGDELLEAKAWIASRKPEAPEVTDLQRAFVMASEEEDVARIAKEREQLEAISRAQQTKTGSEKPEYFVSYAWGDSTPEGLAYEAIVDKLCASAEQRGISILRDRKSLGLGQRISSFMLRLGEADRVFVVLSDKYLKSPYCMYELSEVWRNCRQDDKEFLSRVRVYTLPTAKIWTPLERAECAVYWKQESAKLESIVKEHGYDILGDNDYRRYKMMKEFSYNIGNILEAVTDILQPRNFEEFEKYGFDVGQAG
jgi:TIR domain